MRLPAVLSVLLFLLPTLALAAPAPSPQVIIELDGAHDIDDLVIRDLLDVYIRNGLTNAADRLQRVRIGTTFRAVTLPDPGVKGREEVKTVMKDRVRRVEVEREWRLFGVQEGAVSGLDRLDARQGLDGKFTFPDVAGQGVDVFVIDSGCDANHPDFSNRASVLVDLTGEGANDLNGHGTHVASTAAGATYGVAKKANILCIKVFDQSGRGSSVNVLRALEEVSKQVAERKRPAVVNMSLGGPRAPGDGETSTERAVKALTDLGVAVVVAAGNESQDACQVSPAFIPEVITVAAIDPTSDTIASFSNFGSCVDVMASGVNIEAAAANSRGTRKLSGTSMSSPHVAGVMAVFMSQGMNHVAAERQLIATATQDAVKGELRGSPNRLAFIGGASGTAKLGEPVRMA
ncbi:peptidase S8/S53 domain-containing protein [Catenaria anguillulae PL171]|uniref:Peptidase S8/S53 domain-containing protein n=1 Tax=Catenaria anguillulae PL171 TaxID=765915 RepID=A0A1Y2HX12_9FUNG|nr:peptidase S8/S53 domain-containing protein [Catenaria anguillulae PL171]